MNQQRARLFEKALMAKKAKEIPCPHCGQDLNLPANATARLAIAARLAEAVHKNIHKFNGNVQEIADLLREWEASA